MDQEELNVLLQGDGAPAGVPQGVGAEDLIAALDALQGTPAGDQLASAQPAARITSMNNRPLRPAVRPKVDGVAAVEGAGAANVTGHISVRTRWWGLMVEIDHDGCMALLAAGGAVAGVLAAAGVSAFVAAIVAASLGVIAALERVNGNGIVLIHPWPGPTMVLPR